ncbi:hypothetical protein AKO1_000830, partial [Acrasis kona]
MFNHSSVCSKNGTCSSPDTCVCKKGFYGPRCEKFDCYGLLSTSNRVCSSNGTCQSPDRCSCNNG